MLYIVATPIGNLKEITYRAVEVLNEVDYIACEDTMHSSLLLKSYNIKKPLVSYHKFNEKSRVEGIVNDLKSGKNIALVSDAGMPGISDPGNIIINALKEENLPYTVISGPSAAINAYVLSGFSMPFTFAGFLPNKNSDKKKLLNELKIYNSTIIFYLSPHSINDEIKAIYEVFGERKVCIARELTKKFEEVIFSTLSSCYSGIVKGEFVLVVEGKTKEKNTLSIEEQVQELIDSGINKNDAIKQVAKTNNLKKNEVYSKFI